jgi:hypothetical protein
MPSPVVFLVSFIPFFTPNFHPLISLPIPSYSPSCSERGEGERAKREEREKKQGKKRGKDNKKKPAWKKKKNQNKEYARHHNKKGT